MPYRPPPKELPGFPRAFAVRPKTPHRGGGLRRRWKDPNGRIYEWDFQHGTVEVYDRHGHHVGEYDAFTADALKPADPSRKVEP